MVKCKKRFIMQIYITFMYGLVYAWDDDTNRHRLAINLYYARCTHISPENALNILFIPGYPLCIHTWISTLKSVPGYPLFICTWISTLHPYLDIHSASIPGYPSVSITGYPLCIYTWIFTLYLYLNIHSVSIPGYPLCIYTWIFTLYIFIPGYPLCINSLCMACS